MSRPRKLRSDRVAGKEMARDLALSRRWAIIARHSILTRDKRKVMLCDHGGTGQKAAYPSRATAEAARRDLESIGAHTHATWAYECTGPIPGRRASHWHLTSRESAAAR